MLLGRHDGILGEKSRVGFPKKFREVVGDELIITFGFEGSLIIVAKNNWQSLLEGTEGKPLTTSITRETQRFLLGNASEVTLDEKGRFIVPNYLKEHAKLTKEVVFLGISRYIELWDKTIWETHQKELTKTISYIAERLGRDES
jgi:MraZ protein